MNETYEWLYDHYALPLMQTGESSAALKEEILSGCEIDQRFLLRDRLDGLCLLVGTEAFTIGLQLGLRLMAGQRPDTLTIQ